MAATEKTPGYTVLARRFRPQSFGDVVGQDHISQALRNAIRANRVAHAYLFTGARGVGKTSSARILAKALNCPNSRDGDPCNECEICQGISAGNDVDVLEIDGASNRGIDDIRQLRANVNVKSMRTKFKLYIIDEVHMLTKEAFNALLKTLEEPPPNVKFVFCTTEPNKVPDTILSRCQRFDFGTIATTNIRERLKQIAEAEGVHVDDGALELVARRAAGSMRDSQSIFDQLLAFGEVDVTAKDVHRLLGTATDDRLTAIVEALVARHQANALVALHDALDSGVQLGELTDQLLFYLRDLLVISTGANSLELLAVSSSSRPVLETQAKKWGTQTIVHAMQILADTKYRMQRVTYGRALAELALIRIAILENLVAVDNVIEHIKLTEPIVAVVQDPAIAEAAQKKNDVAPDKAAPEPSKVESTREDGPDNSIAVPAEAAPKLKVSAHEVVVSTPLPESEAAKAPVEPHLESPATGVSNRSGPPEAHNSDVSAPPFSHDDPAEFWSQVVAEIGDLLKSHAKSASRIAIVGPNKLEIGFSSRYQFSRKYCETPETIRRLEEISSRIAKVPLRIQVSGYEEQADTVVTPVVAQRENRASKRVFKPEDDAYVSEVIALFEAQVVKVEPVVPDEKTPNEP